MRSEHVDRFNHDDEAPTYDSQVLDETDPIRTGYDELLTWVAQEACVGEGRRILELGCGTGNLTVRLPVAADVVCVDVSEEMTRRARAKLQQQGRTGRFDIVHADLLECFEADLGRFDVVVSTYTIHHLTAAERSELYRRIAASLLPDGHAVLGDLMFESTAAREEILGRYRERGREELADEIEEEFFWNLERDLVALGEAGFAVECRRFSELSWGVLGVRTAEPVDSSS